MSVYLLEPIDTQFYRTTIPFDAGADSHTVTEPFPWPRTVYGALRAAGFSKENVSLADEAVSQKSNLWGDWQAFGKAVIKGPFIYQREAGGTEVLLPMPADMVVEKGRRKKIHFCVPDERDSLCHSSDCDVSRYPGLCFLKVCNLPESKQVETPGETWLLRTGNLPEAARLGSYLLQELEGENADQYLRPIEQVVAVESRVGITRSRKLHTAEDGQLYAASHHRLFTQQGQGETGFWVKVEDQDGNDVDLAENRVLRLGGENRPAACRKTMDQTLNASWASRHQNPIVKTICANNGRFKLVLITPGLFEGRCHPFEQGTDRITIRIPGKNRSAKLLGIAMDHRRQIGGWNIRENRPKPLDTAVPAGAVYFFRAESWPDDPEQKQQAAKDWMEALNFKSLCSQDLGKEGFGIVLMGGWHV